MTLGLCNLHDFTEYGSCPGEPKRDFWLRHKLSLSLTVLLFFPLSLSFFLSTVSSQPGCLTRAKWQSMPRKNLLTTHTKCTSSYTTRMRWPRCHGNVISCPGPFCGRCGEGHLLWNTAGCFSKVLGELNSSSACIRFCFWFFLHFSQSFFYSLFTASAMYESKYTSDGILRAVASFSNTFDWMIHGSTVQFT